MDRSSFQRINEFSNLDLSNYPDLFGLWQYSLENQIFIFSRSIVDTYFSDLKNDTRTMPQIFGEKVWTKFLSHINNSSIAKQFTLHYTSKSQTYSIVLFNMSKNENMIEGFCSIFKISNPDISLVSTQNEAKFRTIGKMAGCLAHEISNPLSIIRMNAEILFSSESLHTNPEKVKEKCEKIISTSDRVAGIVRALRSINASTQKPNFTWVRLSDLANDILELSKYKFKEEQIKITFHLSHLANESFYLDYAQITQALLNLINNSADAIKDISNKWILIECKLEHDSLIIDVTDSGPCISPETVEKLKTDLFSTKATSGLGLGLGLVQAYLSSHGGHLEYQPKNNNTCFSIHLPLHSIKPIIKSPKLI